MGSFAKAVFLALALLVGQAWAEKYGAIAYSPATGKYGYSSDCATRAGAEKLALSNCIASDARIAIWVKDGWAALYRNSNGAWHSAWSGNSRQEAESIAKSKVPGGTLLCWVFSGR
jgi:hypothetical protein